MKHTTTLLAGLTMMVISSCSKCPTPTPSKNLKQVIFQKPDGTKYTFEVTEKDGNGLLTDDTHKIQLTIVGTNAQSSGDTYGKGYVIGYGSDTTSTVNITFGASNGVSGFKSITKDSTKAYNLGNTVYDVSTSPISRAPAAKPNVADYFNLTISNATDVFTDSLHTADSTIFDITGKTIVDFNTGTPRTHRGDHYYRYTDNMGIWLAACAIGFADITFDNVVQYHEMRYVRSLEMDKVSYYKNNQVVSSYNYTYTLDDTNYLVTKKTITDNSGKVYTVEYVYK